MKAGIRPPAVAGLFYPASTQALIETVDGLLEAADTGEPEQPRALIAPHAGYIFSGLTAAHAFSLLRHHSVRRVVLLGPVHRVPVRGLALPVAEAFATPLGVVPLDWEGMRQIERMPQIVVFDGAHQMEHSLEVQLPFLQRALEDFTLVPLAVGDASGEEVADVLEAFAADPDTLILISSDLSHYHAYAEAQRLDAATADAILRLQTPISHQQACGATPINGLLTLAGRRNLRAKQLDLRNSGDTAGDRNRVVGYGAFAFSEGKSDG